jgi:hypothetical protein
MLLLVYGIGPADSDVLFPPKRSSYLSTPCHIIFNSTPPVVIIVIVKDEGGSAHGLEVQLKAGPCRDAILVHASKTNKQTDRRADLEVRIMSLAPSHWFQAVSEPRLNALAGRWRDRHVGPGEKDDACRTDRIRGGGQLNRGRGCHRVSVVLITLSPSLLSFSSSSSAVRRRASWRLVALAGRQDGLQETRARGPRRTQSLIIFYFSHRDCLTDRTGIVPAID